MSSSDPRNSLGDVVTRIDYVIDAVEERGYDDIVEECDDYSVLLERCEFRKLVIFELYEAYFPPKRHEFELEILTSLVEAVASNKPVVFLMGATAAGIVGNAAYDVLTKTLAHIVQRFKTTKRSRDGFREISDTLQGIRKFFQTRDRAGTDEVCDALGLEPRRVEPLLKLLGFKCQRKRKRNIWRRPSSW
jgi:hypothetical protein